MVLVTGIHTSEICTCSYCRMQMCHEIQLTSSARIARPLGSKHRSKLHTRGVLGLSKTIAHKIQLRSLVRSLHWHQQTLAATCQHGRHPFTLCRVEKLPACAWFAEFAAARRTALELPLPRCSSAHSRKRAPTSSSIAPCLLFAVLIDLKIRSDKS